MTLPQRNFVIVLVLGLATLIGIAPLISLGIAMAAANAGGCALDEGSVHPCILFGHDFGETLYTMAMMAWFEFFVLPVLAAALLGWLVFFAVAIYRRLWR